MKPFDAYIICTSPRSGSTLLCTLLGNTGRAGAPDSHFHAPSLARWQEVYGLRPDAFATRHAALNAVFSAAQTRGRAETDIFGLRLQGHSLDYFMRQLKVLFPKETPEMSRIQFAFGRTLFIHLTRLNKLEQAISFVKATQTGLWHAAPDGTELERLTPPEQPVYDASAIGMQLAECVAMDEKWETWFDTQGIEPLRVTYEDLASGPHETLNCVLDRLGLDHEPADDPLPLARLADATNSQWAALFAADRST